MPVEVKVLIGVALTSLAGGNEEPIIIGLAIAVIIGIGISQKQVICVE